MIIFRRLFLLCIFSNITFVFAKTGTDKFIPHSNLISISNHNNQFQQSQIDTVIIRFDYKQSALFYAYTFAVLDSVIKILLHDTAVKIAINGYAYKDEGSDTICYYLSLNRALFIQTYIVGRGVDSSRITSLNAYGKKHPKFTNKDKEGFLVNCRAELSLTYPPPPKKPEFFDRDEDGIADNEDRCPDVFGYYDNSGCPDENAVIVPFAIQESALYAMTFNVLDSVVAVLRENPTLTVSISGYAHLAEGAYSLCQSLAAERAEIVKQYLLSRLIPASRILSVKNYGISRPLNPAKNPQQILRNVRAEIMIIE